MSVTGNQQEWLFKLYALDDSGKVTKEVYVCLSSILCKVSGYVKLHR